MSIRRFDDFESGIEEVIENQEMGSSTTLVTKLERRRRIEEIEEERRLRDELGDF
jgi:hypothetical protein